MGELRRGLKAEGFDVLYVLLDTEIGVLVERIRSDEDERAAGRWRLDHVNGFVDRGLGSLRQVTSQFTFDGQ